MLFRQHYHQMMWHILSAYSDQHATNLTQRTQHSEANSSSTSWENLRILYAALEGSQPVILIQSPPPQT